MYNNYYHNYSAKSHITRRKVYLQDKTWKNKNKRLRIKPWFRHLWKLTYSQDLLSSPASITFPKVISFSIMGLKLVKFLCLFSLSCILRLFISITGLSCLHIIIKTMYEHLLHVMEFRALNKLSNRTLQLYLNVSFEI